MAAADQTGDRRTDIVAAALACFARKGVGATTIADIREASGASTGSLYHHFGDKDGIAGRVYLEVLRRYHASYLERLETCRSGEEAVRTTVRHYVEWVMANRDAARLLVEARHSPQVVGAEAEIRAETRRVLESAHAVLRRFVEAGELRDLPPAVTTALLVSPCSALVGEWLRRGRPAEAKAEGELLAEAAWRSMRTDPAAGSAGTSAPRNTKRRKSA